MNSRKLKILHIGNGKAFKIKAIISFFRERGHEIHFIPVPATEVRWEGVIYHHFQPAKKFSKIQVLKNIFSVRRIVKEVRPDIVHAHNAMGPGWYGAFCAHKPFVIHAYGSDVLPYIFKAKNLVSRLMTQYACQRSDKIIVTGKHMIQGISHLKLPEDKIEIIPRGVKLKNFSMGLDTSVLRKELKLGNAAPVILSPRYQIDKGLYNFDTILRSILDVKKYYPNVVFIQLYDNTREEDKRKYEIMSLSLGVSENYKMVEMLENEQMPYLYNLADIVVSVPSSDGFPVTVLEASACGTPMIVTKLDYTSEWFVDEENGILIPERDHHALADAIIRLYKDRDLREKMKKINRRLVEERADYEVCMTKLEQLYYKLLSSTDN
jgi:glycosyltransferase involved in cell wall biosynthesis